MTTEETREIPEAQQAAVDSARRFYLALEVARRIANRANLMRSGPGDWADSYPLEDLERIAAAMKV